MSQFKRGDRVFVEAVVENETLDGEGDIRVLIREVRRRSSYYVDPAFVHASLPEKHESSPVGNALFAWRAWMKEAIMYEHEGESAAGCVDIAREIREGAAVGFVLDCGEVES